MWEKQFNLRFHATYRPRRPEETVLYQAVAANYRTFEALAELEGKRLPQHVTKEFESFLRCGILAYGFLRLRCDDCHKEKLLAFSCKKRGFCSSCGGRRMAESAAHLVDEVFPRVGVRQWVLSFPMPLRFILAQNAGFQARCLTIVHRAITTLFPKESKAPRIARSHPAGRGHADPAFWRIAQFERPLPHAFFGRRVLPDTKRAKVLAERIPQR